MGYIGQFPSAAVLTGNQIPDNVITSAKIADGTVIAADIFDNTVTLAKIATNAVDTGQLVNDAVTSAKIATNAVDTGQLINNAVTSAKIATNAVDTGQLINNAVTSAKILNGAVTSDKLNTISNVNITGGNITNANIFDVGLKVSQISSSSNAITLNYETATVFVCNATENANITLTNFPESGVALLKLTYGGNYTISYAGNAKFATGTAPILTAAGLDHLYFEGNVNGYLVTSVLDIQAV
jgi:hypothetical protein